jgi:hypothetical protein
VCQNLKRTPAIAVSEAQIPTESATTRHSEIQYQLFEQDRAVHLPSNCILIPA